MDVFVFALDSNLALKTGGLKMKVYGLHSSPILNVSRWWQLKYFLFSYLFGEDSQFDEYFSNGLVQPPTIDVFF